MSRASVPCPGPGLCECNPTPCYRANPAPLLPTPPPSLAELFSHIDPYVAVWYGDHKLGCTVAYGNQPNPVWNEVGSVVTCVLGGDGLALLRSSCSVGVPSALSKRFGPLAPSLTQEPAGHAGSPSAGFCRRAVGRAEALPHTTVGTMSRLW